MHVNNLEISSSRCYFGIFSPATDHKNQQFRQLADQHCRNIVKSSFALSSSHNHPVSLRKVIFRPHADLLVPSQLLAVSCFSIMVTCNDLHASWRLADSLQNYGASPYSFWAPRRPAAVQAFHSVPPASCRKFPSFIRALLHFTCYMSAPCQILDRNDTCYAFIADYNVAIWAYSLSVAIWLLFFMKSLWLCCLCLLATFDAASASAFQWIAAIATPL